MKVSKKTIARDLKAAHDEAIRVRAILDESTHDEAVTILTHVMLAAWVGSHAEEWNAAVRRFDAAIAFISASN